MWQRTCIYWPDRLHHEEEMHLLELDKFVVTKHSTKLEHCVNFDDTTALARTRFMDHLTKDATDI
jgi:hypothetical protein